MSHDRLKTQASVRMVMIIRVPQQHNDLHQLSNYHLLREVQTPLLTFTIATVCVTK
jgi:hypothetical protein